MAVALKPALDKFAKQSETTLDWLGATEALWQLAPPTTSVRTRLRVPQLEALYEAAFLRIFTAWENVIEDVTLRMMARASTPQWKAAPATGAVLHSNIGAARVALYGTRDYILWHNPQISADRIAKHIAASPIEAELRASGPWLGNLGQVRHRIAHSSEDASQKFEAAAQSLTGSHYKGVPGRLLRSQDLSDSLNPQRWIKKFCDELNESANRFAQ